MRRSSNHAIELKNALELHGVRVLTELNDGHKSIDLAIPSARLNIEVDGRQHYTDPYQILADLNRSHYSAQLGYSTIHIPNVFVQNELKAVASALAEAAKIREGKLRAKVTL